MRGFVGVGNRLQSHSCNGSDTTAIKENQSDESFVLSFSNVIQQFEGTNSETKEQFLIESIDHKEPEISIEEAIVPFLYADAEELAEHFDPEMVTNVIIHAIAQEDQGQINQKALGIGVKDAITDPVTQTNQTNIESKKANNVVPLSQTHSMTIVEQKNVDSLAPKLTRFSSIEKEFLNPVSEELDEFRAIPSENKNKIIMPEPDKTSTQIPLNPKLDESINQVLLKAKSNGSMNQLPLKFELDESVTPITFMPEFEESGPFMQKKEVDLSNNQEKNQPSLFRMPISALKSYPVQGQQATQLIEDQVVQEQTEILLDTIKRSVDLPKLHLLSEDAELFQQVASKVETFFQSKDQTTLNQLITEIKDTVRPTFRKPVDMEIEGALNDLESSEELEKLLMFVKTDKSAMKAKDDTLRPLVVESRVEKTEHFISNQTFTSRSFNERVNKEASEMELKPTVHSVLPEEGSKSTDRAMAPTVNDMKSTALNESLLAPVKTVHVSDRVQQQAETLKAEGQTEERRFVKTLQRILQQGSMTQRSDGQTTLTLKLFPEHLGKLQIQVIQSGQKLAAQIIAESSATKDLVERSLPQLRQALNSQNVAFDQIDVEEFVDRDQQQQQEQEQSDHPDHQKGENESRTETSFSFKSLLEGLFS